MASDEYPQLSIHARLVGQSADDDTPRLAAYAFASNGERLGYTEINEDREGTIPLDTETARRVHVLVGPAPEKGNDDAASLPSRAELLRQGALEQIVTTAPQAELASLHFHLPHHLWPCWLQGLCVARGVVVKRITENGETIDLPVCDAEVVVYEVDPWWQILETLPLVELERIRPEILQPPIETRGPFPQPLQFVAERGTELELRSGLIDHLDFVRPILCQLYHPWVRRQKIATATTDEKGEFQALFTTGCSSDEPDLYFEVYQTIDGVRTKIYGPTPVGCHTRWNYDCGQEVTLITTHPGARTCPPPYVPADELDALWVTVMHIGNLSLADIHGTSASLAGSTNAQNRGLATASAPLLGRPFGGLCRLHMEFDTNLAGSGTGAGDGHYYRVSWRKQGAPGGFLPLSGSVTRWYEDSVSGNLVFVPYHLGPHNVGSEGDLFEIPGALGPGGKPWRVPDIVEAHTNAKFPTHTLPPAGDPTLSTAAEMLAQAGKYELKVEIFDQAGNHVALSGDQWRTLAQEDTTTGVFSTTAAGSLGLVDGNGDFVMILHVDNNRCTASIGSPTVNGLSATNNCGVLEYPNGTATVGVPFTADHPNQFATYGFRLRRNVTNVVNTGGLADGPETVTRTVDQIIGPCAAQTGGVAAYAAILNVDAAAINGWGRLSAYDDDDVRPFVLKEE